SADVVAGADGDLVELVEDVELRQGEGVEAVEHRRGPHDREVEPAGTAGAAGDGAELVAAAAEVLAGRVVELRRERAAADARRVRLGHAQHAVDVLRGHAEAGAYAAGHRVRRRHERVRDVVDVEYRPLRSLEHNSAACG